MNDNRLGKKRRIKGLNDTQRLFNNDNALHVKAFPIKAVVNAIDNNDTEPLRMMVSVGKRHFKHATDRNRVKRQIREAFRKNCQQLREKAKQQGKNIDVAFIWMADNIFTTDNVEKKIIKLLEIIIDKCLTNNV